MPKETTTTTTTNLPIAQRDLELIERHANLYAAVLRAVKKGDKDKLREVATEFSKLPEEARRVYLLVRRVSKVIPAL